jgi:hypothetical protein
MGARISSWAGAQGGDRPAAKTELQSAIALGESDNDPATADERA